MAGTQTKPFRRGVEQGPARGAHNAEVVGSSPTTATTFTGRQLEQLRALIDERDALVADVLRMQVLHMRVMRARLRAA